ncbi:MAG: Cof-type HAD-IIB family hydrolase [Synergistetes bacterium]|nr:Cof-type HAD-IIB family hydrolase [Synergistota bacterium]MDW8192078.1 HAD family hydrolase [Synergistota bacterium]
MKYKLIVFDLDGTLLSPQKILTSRVIKAIERACACGLNITISTGRTFPSAKPYIEALNIGGLVSFQNSALMVSFDPMEVYRLVNFPRSKLVEAVCLAKDLGLFSMLFIPSFTSPYIVMEKIFPHDSKFSSYFEKSVFNAILLNDIVEAFKMSLSFNELVVVGKVEKVEMFISESCGKGLSFVMNSKVDDEVFLEIYGPECSKEVSLYFFSKFYEIPLDRIVFVGDNLNDIDAIRKAGLGVAMENAPEEVKKEADLIIPSNADDGVASFLEEILSERKKFFA